MREGGTFVLLLGTMTVDAFVTEAAQKDALTGVDVKQFRRMTLVRDPIPIS